MHTYEMLVLEHHLDTLGHMNNAVYLEILEEARWDFITRGGFGLRKIQETKTGPVILEVNLRFQKEINLRDKIRIETEVLKYEGKIGQLRQRIIKENNDQAAEAIFAIGFFDLDTRKLIPPSPEWKAVLGI